MWHSIGSVDDFPDDEAVTVSIGEKQLAIYSIDGRLFATDALCSHGRAYLADGYLEGEEIECPLHQGRFHVPTGKALCSPITEDINTFEVKSEGGEVSVMII